MISHYDPGGRRTRLLPGQKRIAKHEHEAQNWERELERLREKARNGQVYTNEPPYEEVSIPVDAVAVALSKVFQELMAQGVFEITVPNAQYWLLNDAERTDLTSAPTANLVGDMRDDLRTIRNLASGELYPSRAALSDFEQVLNRISLSE